MKYLAELCKNGECFKKQCWSSCHGSLVMNATKLHGDVGSNPGLAQLVNDLALLWLWLWLADVALIQFPSLETSIGHRCVPKKQKKKRLIYSIFFFRLFLELHPQHMEVPRLGG